MQNNKHPVKGSRIGQQSHSMDFMQGYFVTQTLVVCGCGQRRQLAAVGDATTPTLTEVIIPAQNELQRVRAALLATYPDQAAMQGIDSLLHVLAQSSFNQIPGWPVSLGVAGAAAPNTMASEHQLVGQLLALRAAMPTRQHFRLLLRNGFGTNLGDNLQGLTAWRSVLAVLRAHLPSVAVDVLLGWHDNDSLQRLFRGVDGIDAVLTQGPTLAGMTRYQAVFDTTGLLTLPRYGALPVVDWYLWWMGLNPDSIAPNRKRNQLPMLEAAHAFVSQRLPPATGPRIVINPLASVPLRSMTDAAVQRLVEGVQTFWPNAQVILLQPLARLLPRVLDMSADITNIDRLAALLALSDGLIGVDSYTQHLADATATPAVTVYTSIEPGQYPYYPLIDALLLPQARDLPAWGQPKVSPEQWVNMADRYAAAWLTLEPQAVLLALQRTMARKATLPVAAHPPALGVAQRPAQTRQLRFGDMVMDVPQHQRDGPLAGALFATLDKLAEQVLLSGDTVAVLGASAGQAALPLAQRVGRHGRLVAFEPRPHLHQLLCANLARAGIYHAQTHAVMPEGDGLAVRAVNVLFAPDEHAPLNLCNSALEEPVVCWPLDALALSTCRLLAVCAPMPLLSVLQGARQTLQRLHPVVLAGVLALSDTPALADYLRQLGYRVNTLVLDVEGDAKQPPKYGIVMAEPMSLHSMFKF